MWINTQDYSLKWTLQKVVIEEIPQNAYDFFVWYSKRFIDPKKLSESVTFHQYYKYVFNKPPYTVYIAHLTCLYDSDPEELLYVFEIDNAWIEIWHGEIRNVQSDNTYFVDKPFVGQTTTREKFHKQWYATRRLEYMQELSKLFFHKNLHSDTVISEYAKKIRENFIQDWKAEKIKEWNNDRYRFTENYYKG